MGTNTSMSTINKRNLRSSANKPQNLVDIIKSIAWDHSYHNSGYTTNAASFMLLKHFNTLQSLQPINDPDGYTLFTFVGCDIVAHWTNECIDMAMIILGSSLCMNKLEKIITLAFNNTIVGVGASGTAGNKVDTIDTCPKFKIKFDLIAYLVKNGRYYLLHSLLKLKNNDKFDAKEHGNQCKLNSFKHVDANAFFKQLLYQMHNQITHFTWLDALLFKRPHSRTGQQNEYDHLVGWLVPLLSSERVNKIDVSIISNRYIHRANYQIVNSLFRCHPIHFHTIKFVEIPRAHDVGLFKNNCQPRENAIQELTKHLAKVGIVKDIANIVSQFWFLLVPIHYF